MINFILNPRMNKDQLFMLAFVSIVCIIMWVTYLGDMWISVINTGHLPIDLRPTGTIGFILAFYIQARQDYKIARRKQIIGMLRSSARAISTNNFAMQVKLNKIATKLMERDEPSLAMEYLEAKADLSSSIFVLHVAIAMVDTELNSFTLKNVKYEKIKQVWKTYNDSVERESKKTV